MKLPLLLQVVRAACGDDVAAQVESHAKGYQTMSRDLARCEQRVQDLVRENERLRRRINELNSRGE